MRETKKNHERVYLRDDRAGITVRANRQRTKEKKCREKRERRRESELLNEPDELGWALYTHAAANRASLSTVHITISRKCTRDACVYIYISRGARVTSSGACIICSLWRPFSSRFNSKCKWSGAFLTLHLRNILLFESVLFLSNEIKKKK